MASGKPRGRPAHLFYWPQRMPGGHPMKMILLALCLAVVVASVWLVWPMVGGEQFIGGPPSPADVRASVFEGLPRGLQ